MHATNSMRFLISKGCIYNFPSRFTARITELLTVLDDLNMGKYERTMVADARGNILGLYSSTSLKTILWFFSKSTGLENRRLLVQSQACQYSFLRFMVVIATRLIPLSLLSIVLTKVMWKSSQWHGKNIVQSTG